MSGTVPIKEAIRAHLIAAGVEAGEVALALDLAQHAVEEATKTLSNVCYRAGSAKGLALQIAMQWMPMICEGAINDFSQSMRQQGNQPIEFTLGGAR